MTLTVKGARELDRLLKTLPGRPAKKAVRSGTLGGAGIVRKEARQNVVEDTGDLKKGIIARKTDESRTHTTYSVGPSTKVYYGQFLEFGTQHVQARPFLRPALEQNVPKVLAKMSKSMGKAIEREAKKLGR